ncbi:MAG: tetratricopeptide repeat protein [Betaproteobacteria bacterium]|nr:tetratricopeptide repeat protein [Betaproteobacteria bacterium]
MGGGREGDGGIDFRMDDDFTVSPASGAEPKTPADILAGAESELEKTARTAGAGAAGLAAAAVAGAAALGKLGADKVEHVADKIDAAEAKFDLDFHLDEADKPAPMRPAAPAETATVADKTPSPARPQAAIDLDKLDLSFDPDKATFEDPTPSVLDGQWHDAATKLDLAKAYQEMGDVEGAREILQEVLHEGDEQQKAEAQSLIARLG